MALLGEEVVEEWLNRNGYFTIRGVKLGVHEVDLLAFKPGKGGKHECRHIEVQISINPVSYISPVPKQIQKEQGLKPNSSKLRAREILVQGVSEWIEKKFDHPRKIELRRRLFDGVWTREFVVHKIKHPEELDIMREQGITVLQMKDIVSEMLSTSTQVPSASGSDLLNLMQLGNDLETD